MGPTVAATITASTESSDGENSAKKKGIRRLLTPAIFAGSDHKNKQAAAAAASSTSMDVGNTAVHNHQHRQPSNNRLTSNKKTIIETAFVNNNGNSNSTGNVAYRLQQQQQQQQQQAQLQRFRYAQGLDRHANDVTDFRSRSVSPGSFDRDVNANYGSGERRMDSQCSLLSSSSTSSLLPSPSGRRSAPIIPYSQYYNNRNGGGGSGSGGGQQQQQQRLLLMPVGAQVKITAPQSSTAVYAAAVRQHRLQQQNQQQQQAIYGNVAAGAVGPFVRGSPHRATIGCVRESPGRQSTIYETEEDVVTAAVAVGEKRFQPIFKRGALQEPATDSSPITGQTPSPHSSGCSPKRVSFSPGPSEPPAYWPTKKGPSPQPPTRQSSTDSPVAAERPLPLVPKRSPSTSAIYGTLQQRGGSQRPHQQHQQQPPNRWWSPSSPSPSPLHQHYQQSGSESGSEAGEVQRILNVKNGHRLVIDDDWSGDGKTRGAAEQAGDELRRGRSSRRDDPRRHTLSGDQHHNYQPALTRSMDLEMGTKMQRKKSPASRGGYPPATGILFDDDPGIMSEVETSSTGFRRGNKQRSSLPVVRTPSKTLERPLGLVFLQYRSETKRALLPNEITSIDTVKALFVRSFPKQLTMEYMDSALVKIYIHDSSKDMFYELEDLRSHLNDIRDRSVLRLFESAEGGPLPQGLTIAAPTWDQDQSYFSEPEFDSEFQHQHIHKTKGSKCTSGGAPGQPYYMTHQFPPGSSATLPNRGRPPTGSIPARAYSPAVPPVAANKSSGYMSSPERANSRTGYTAAPYMSPGGSSFDDNSYYGYGPRTGSITPVIDEETSDNELMEDPFSMYAAKPSSITKRPTYGNPPPTVPYDATRIRVENMERQIANLTGLVQKALTHAPVVAPPFRNASDEFDKVSVGSTTSLAEEPYKRSDTKPPKLGRDKSVSFEKSVSFSDEPPDMNSPKQHSPQSSADTKPAKPAIKSSTLPRTASQEKDRFKPHPPPKPSAIPGQYDERHLYSDLQLTPEMYNQLRVLQKKAKDLRQEARNLRRMSQAQAHSIRETIKDTFIKIRALIASGADQAWSESGSKERAHVDREEDIYRQEIIRLETDLTELESTVEELRGNVINKKSRVNMSDVENMALVLSKSSKTVAELKLRFPSLQESIRTVLTKEMDRAVTEEKFLKEEPDRLESALKRCKKLTGTLVTLKRLASVQEQRLPDARLSPTNEDTPPITPTSSAKGSIAGQGSVVEQTGTGTDDGAGGAGKREPTGAENALDTLLDELQTTPAAAAAVPVESVAAEPTVAAAEAAEPMTVAGPAVPVAPKPVLRRLSSTSSETGGKPPVPERTPDLQNKRMPPPPPPRTSSKSPVASPTTAGSAVGALSSSPRGSMSSSSAGGSPPSRKGSLTTVVALGGCGKPPMPEPPTVTAQPPPSVAAPTAVATATRQEQLEQRHQELLKKQKALQEQYTRLQQLQRSQPPPDLLQLKKTGSEGNLLLKMGLSMSAAAPISGSLTQLAAAVTTGTTGATANDDAEKQRSTANNKTTAPAAATTTTTTTTTVNKVYETDII
ncbi:coiled-coil domain-containing protein AGAP005037 isoform X5 [Rhopalosiphum padi]|uniref:coiled-coil domain-containing protein AGAP005037 isoform X5 n=1 Tax=Rhopalosiphum padi TaxID=40932 RepID=UPI00298E774E|nr:coiled-coil domain-containing protein AGAP005037 isoform X5 [Rhopalosiphum padi]